MQEGGEGCTLGSVDDLDPSEWQVIIIPSALSNSCLGLQIQSPAMDALVHTMRLMSPSVYRAYLTVA